MVMLNNRLSKNAVLPDSGAALKRYKCCDLNPFIALSKYLKPEDTPTAGS
jgi:hypothetical protein